MLLSMFDVCGEKMEAIRWMVNRLGDLMSASEVWARLFVTPV